MRLLLTSSLSKTLCPSVTSPVAFALRGFATYRSPAFGPFKIRPRPTPINTVILFVPQQEAWVVERFGKFNRILEPGLEVCIPFIDRIRYVRTLKEVAVEVPTQSAITQGTQVF